jgi:hypothetical protein
LTPLCWRRLDATLNDWGPLQADTLRRHIDKRAGQPHRRKRRQAAALQIEDLSITETLQCAAAVLT